MIIFNFLIIYNFLKLLPFSQGQNDSIRNDGLLPQLFTSVPALNEAASYLAQTTSLITGCFSDYSGKLRVSSILFSSSFQVSLYYRVYIFSWCDWLGIIIDVTITIENIILSQFV